MARDRTARARVRQLLATSGPVRDPSGYATGELKDAIGYRGSAVAFIQLIAAMERDGEIVREIRGKRTYQIAATPETVDSVAAYPEAGHPVPSAARPESADSAAEPAPVAATSAAEPLDALARAGIELDYDELAKAILRQLWSAAKVTASASAAAPPAKTESEHDEYTRRLEAARDKLDELLDVDRHRSPTSAAKG